MEKIIRKISANIIHYMAKSHIICNCNCDIYMYGLQVIIELFFNIIISFLIACRMHMVKEYGVFLGIFILLRAFAGGFHLKSFSGCSVLSNISVAIILFLVRSDVIRTMYLLGSYIFAILVIKLFSDSGYFSKKDDKIKIKNCYLRLNITIVGSILLIVLSFFIKETSLMRTVIITYDFMAIVVLLNYLLFRNR